MIDTHCHIDMYKNPHSVAEESEKLGIITIGMTLLPSHFELGYKHILRYKKVRLALGMHPLKSELHNDEFDNFLYFLNHTSYVGEIGLDYSNEGIRTKDLQINSFRKILFSIKDKRKIVSLHSRRAEKEVLHMLIEYNIKNVIFHWYSGPVKLIKEITDNGYYFSINPAMIRSLNGKKIIQAIPKHRVLTESDGPYVLIENSPIKPKNIILVQEYLSVLWEIPIEMVNEQIDNNFALLVEHIKPNNLDTGK
jgi:TatD DNase family protein